MRLVLVALVSALPLQSGCGGTTEARVPVRVVAAPDKPTLRLSEPDPVPTAPAPAPHTRQVILVVIDGVRWQDVFLGVDRALAPSSLADASGEELMPNLHALGRRGVVLGAPSAERGISATGPNYASLPGYTEMLTGKAPACQANVCPPTREPSWLDRCAALPEHRPGDAALVSSWENIALVASRSPRDLPISAGRHHLFGRSLFARDAELLGLLDRHARGFPAPGGQDYRVDAATAEIALGYLESARPRCLFVGLGDTDEHAHRGDYVSYVGALRRFDLFVGELVARLDGMDDYGRSTTVVVTTDHGRSAGFVSHGRSPEASKVFLFAAGGEVPLRGVVEPAAERTLSDIPGTLLALAGDEGASAAIPELIP